MSSRRSPESRAREAVMVLAVGLVVLTLLAVALYRLGSPRWTHVMIDGAAWMLVVSTGAMMALSAVEKLVEVSRRHLPH
jgi:multisubunit Na+/H+ antiporter MnhB subunit